MDSIWFQLFIEFFGAFLGFLFAALLSGLSEKHAQKKKYKTILNSLIIELSDISKALGEHIKSNDIISTRIAIPTWDALQYSGLTLDLIEESYFDKIVEAYALIKLFNEHCLLGKGISIEIMQTVYDTCEIALKEIKAERKQ